MKMNRERSNRFSSILFVLVLSAAAFAQGRAPELPDPGNPGMSRDQQQQLGLQAAAEVYKQMPVLADNSQETQYIRRLGEKLAATIPSDYSWPFEFHVIAQKDINAFALPGGPMFVNIGTINAAANEAQLAGVMAHEMAHVYMQHSAKQQDKANVTGLIAGIAGAVLGARGGTLGSLAQAGVQIGAGAVMLKYSRSDESQADAVGAIILYKAGYNPEALADFFQRLEEESGGSRGPQFLSDHPNPGNREQAIQRQVDNWPEKNYQTNSADFNRVKQHAATVPSFTAEEIANGAKSGRWDQLNRKNGSVFRGASGTPTSSNTPAPEPTRVSLNQVLPSSQMVSADLGPVRLSHPRNWQVIRPQQQGGSLTIAPSAGVAGNGIGYGVVLNGGSVSNGQASLDQVTQELVRSMQSAGNEVQTVGRMQTIRVAGRSGRSVAMQSTSPFLNSRGQQQKERDWLVTVPHPDGSFLYFVFVAPQAEFNRFRPAFENMLRSVEF